MKNTQKLVPIAELILVAMVKLMEVPKERNAADSYQWVDVSASSIGCTFRGELLTTAFPPYWWSLQMNHLWAWDFFVTL